MLVTITGSGARRLYTKTTEPLTHNFDNAPVATAADAKDVKHLWIPYPVSLNFLWDDASIGRIAKENGITRLHYADLETYSILFGIWTRRYIHLYGR